MSKITLASHDTRAATRSRIRPTHLGAPLAFLPTSLGLGAVGVGAEVKPGDTIELKSPVYYAVTAGIGWGILGAIAGAIRGDKALKWGTVGAASGAAFGAVSAIAMNSACPSGKYDKDGKCVPAETAAAPAKP